MADIKQILRFVRKDSRLKKIYIIHPQPKEALDYLSKRYRHIIAAGGIVKNKKGDLLFIRKNKKWDLPKGQVKKGEKKKAAALRETSEECGVKQLEVIAKIGKTYHIGSRNGKRFFKTTHWFEMNCFDEQNISPDISEGITGVKWVKKSLLADYLENSYANLQNLMNYYLENISK